MNEMFRCFLRVLSWKGPTQEHKVLVNFLFFFKRFWEVKNVYFVHVMSGTLKATVFACTVNSINHVTEEHHHDAITPCCWKVGFFL